MANNKDQGPKNWLEALFWPVGDRAALVADIEFFLEVYQQPWDATIKMPYRLRAALRDAKIDRLNKIKVTADEMI